MAALVDRLRKRLSTGGGGSGGTAGPAGTPVGNLRDWLNRPAPEWLRSRTETLQALGLAPESLDPADLMAWAALSPAFIAMARFLPPRAVERLLARMEAGEGIAVGSGADFTAKMLRDPEVGPIVLKRLGGYRGASELAGSHVPLDEALNLMDRMAGFGVPTQKAAQAGAIYLLQPFVEKMPVSAKAWDRLASRLQKIAEARNIGLMDTAGINRNIIYGKVGGRTRPWLVDVGTMKDITPYSQRAVPPSPPMPAPRVRTPLPEPVSVEGVSGGVQRLPSHGGVANLQPWRHEGRPRFLVRRLSNGLVSIFDRRVQEAGWFWPTGEWADVGMQLPQTQARRIIAAAGGVPRSGAQVSAPRSGGNPKGASKTAPGEGTDTTPSSQLPPFDEAGYHRPVPLPPAPLPPASLPPLRHNFTFWVQEAYRRGFQPKVIAQRAAENWGMTFAEAERAVQAVLAGR